MKCKNCGNEVNPQDAFCQYCGSPVSLESNSADTETTVLKRQTNDAETVYLKDEVDEAETTYLGMDAAGSNGNSYGNQANNNRQFNNAGQPNANRPYNNGGQPNTNGQYNNMGQRNVNGQYNNMGQSNVNGQYNNMQQPNQQYYNGQPNRGYQPNGGFANGNGGMKQPEKLKWFHFIIYFQLFLVALANCGQGMLAIVGSFMYDFEVVNGLIFIESMKLVNIILGIISIAAGIFAIIVRQKMSRFEKDSIKLYYVLFVALLVVKILYTIITVIVFSSSYSSLYSEMNNIITELGTVVIIGIGYICANIKYFNKRANLFVN